MWLLITWLDLLWKWMRMHVNPIPHLNHYAFNYKICILNHLNLTRNIHWILPWGIEMLIVYGETKTLRSMDWLVIVETRNNGCKTLHPHDRDEKVQVYKKQGYGVHCENKCWKGHIDPPHPCHPWMDDSNEIDHACMVQSQ